MRSFFQYCLLLFGTIVTALPAVASTDYAQSIYAANLNHELFRQSVTDLKICLQKSTGKSFSVFEFKNTAGKGIYLVLNQPGLLNSSLTGKLSKGTIEDFVVMGNENRLLLIANHPLGLSRAIYFYLDKLGFKWYLPGEEWAHVPSLSDIALSTTQYVTPSFKIRNFFGTGGIMPVKALDPNASVNQKWNDWRRRNRFGGQFDLGGHYGETFNSKYKAELQQHPEFLALVKGNRQWSASAKWCISNKNLRDLFIADRVEELKAALYQSKYDNEIIPVSVDPADGYGDCECDNCKRMGTVSDRDFFLANEVAKQFQKISPRAYANIYAYNTHVAPPSFKLNPNLIVQLVPYAFQNVGTAEQLITQWKKKHNNLFIYDYYGVPDWHWDTPLTGGWSLDAWIKKLTYWKAQGIQGFMTESSFSLASTGLGLYLSARLGWDAAESPGIIIRSFYTQLFGPSAPYIQAYFQKLSSNFSGAADLPYLLDLLYKADNESTSPEVQQRITALKAYLHYLTLYYRWQQDPHNETILNNLFQYLFQLHTSGIIHSTRLAQLLYKNIPQKSSLYEKWKITEPAGPGVTGLKKISWENIETLFVQDRKTYPMLEGFDYTNKINGIEYKITNPNGKISEDKEGLMILALPITYVQPSSDGSIQFSVKVNETSVNNNQQRITIRLLDTATKAEVISQEVDIDRNWKKISLKAPAGKTYQLGIRNPNWIRFSVSADQWLAFKNIPTYTMLGKLWFYVGDKEKYIYYKNDATTQPVFVDPAGNRVAPQKVNDHSLYRVEVTEAASGKWWTIAGTEYKNLQFFNQPDLFFTNNNYSIQLSKQ